MNRWLKYGIAIVVLGGLVLGVQRYAAWSTQRDHERAYAEAYACVIGEPLGRVESPSSRFRRVFIVSPSTSETAWPRSCEPALARAETARAQGDQIVTSTISRPLSIASVDGMAAINVDLFFDHPPRLPPSEKAIHAPPPPPILDGSIEPLAVGSLLGARVGRGGGRDFAVYTDVQACIFRDGFARAECTPSGASRAKVVSPSLGAFEEGAQPLVFSRFREELGVYLRLTKTSMVEEPCGYGCDAYPYQNGTTVTVERKERDGATWLVARGGSPVGTITSGREGHPAILGDTIFFTQVDRGKAFLHATGIAGGGFSDAIVTAVDEVGPVTILDHCHADAATYAVAHVPGKTIFLSRSGGVWHAVVTKLAPDLDGEGTDIVSPLTCDATSATAITIGTHDACTLTVSSFREGEVTDAPPIPCATLFPDPQTAPDLSYLAHPEVLAVPMRDRVLLVWHSKQLGIRGRIAKRDELALSGAKDFVILDDHSGTGIVDNERRLLSTGDAAVFLTGVHGVDHRIAAIRIDDKGAVTALAAMK